MAGNGIGRWVIVAAALVLAAGCESAEQKSIARSNALMDSLKQRSFPGLPATLTDEQALEIDRARSGKGRWFVETGCFACHSVSVYGVKSYSQMGPDLSISVEDVEKRFGRKLDDFWREPNGTMTMVRTQLIKLTPEEVEKSLQLLKDTYADYQRQKGN